MAVSPVIQGVIESFPSRMTMITRFDHAVLAVDDLAAATAVLSLRIGLSVRRAEGIPASHDNAVVRFGLDYLQIASIVDRDGRRRPA